MKGNEERSSVFSSKIFTVTLTIFTPITVLLKLNLNPKKFMYLNQKISTKILRSQEIVKTADSSKLQKNKMKLNKKVVAQKM